MNVTFNEFKKVLPHLNFESDKPLNLCTSFNIGGNADWFVYPRSVKELKGVLTLCKKYQLKTFIIGGGSNLLVSDDGFRGVVISLERFNKMCAKKGSVVVGAGAKTSALLAFCLSHELSGLEFLVGIPACVGGAIHNNAGAFGCDMANVVKSVTVLSNGHIKRLPLGELDFGYRQSRFQKTQEIILSVELELVPSEKDAITQKMQGYFGKRKNTQPSGASAGCVFKKSENYSAGLLIDKAGLKGLCVGGAIVSAKHANFIINTGDATAKDVMALIEKIKEEVFVKFGVKLSEEIEFVGR